MFVPTGLKCRSCGGAVRAVRRTHVSRLVHISQMDELIQERDELLDKLRRAGLIIEALRQQKAQCGR